jgi:hypothetical protein
MCYKTDSASKEGGGGGYIADPASNKAYLSLITGWGILEELSFSDICIVLLVLTKKNNSFWKQGKKTVFFQFNTGALSNEPTEESSDYPQFNFALPTVID